MVTDDQLKRIISELAYDIQLRLEYLDELQEESRPIRLEFAKIVLLYKLINEADNLMQNGLDW